MVYGEVFDITVQRIYRTHIMLLLQLLLLLLLLPLQLLPLLLLQICTAQQHLHATH